ncbi:MAG: domain S-box [Bacteroidetes bacterium]|jgi:signal transduction histidine kinase|nr:domain S-box [Bacteroidota bacterium]
MKIKTKLSIGLGFLFLVIILIGSVAVIYIHRIASESKEILKDNYESVQLSKTMMKQIDMLETDTAAFYLQMSGSLHRQEKNITEPGEKEYTGELRAAFDDMKSSGRKAVQLKKMKRMLYEISDLNMQAILKKNDRVQANAGQVLLYIGLIGSLCFVIVFTFIINFPGYIANPIKKLTESIRQISEKHYDQRLEITSKDEFGDLAKAFNAMAERLEYYENSNVALLLFEKQRIEAIINNMNDAIIGLDENGMVLFANIRAAQLIGMQESGMLGKYAGNLAINNSLMQLLLSDIDAGSQPLKLLIDAKENYFSRERISVQSEGKPIGEVILLKNVTHFREQDLAKTNFIATISHELKTPIASIKLSTKLLEDTRVGGLNDEQQQLVHTIKEDSERLLKLTAEVLNMAQVETGKIQLNFQRVKAETVLRYAIDSLRFQADQKQLTIHTEQQENLPEINADLEKTVWVLVNLLGNAIRYSPENERILLSVNREGGEVRFSVRDFGPGIERQYQDKLFNQFFRVPGSNKAGTGLGLAIAKEFIVAQKGHIGLTSTVGEGSTFFFQLPVAWS